MEKWQKEQQGDILLNDRMAEKMEKLGQENPMRTSLRRERESSSVDSERASSMSTTEQGLNRTSSVSELGGGRNSVTKLAGQSDARARTSSLKMNRTASMKLGEDL